VKNKLRWAYMLLLLLFLYAPLVVLVVTSFNNSGMSGKFTGFSFKWYIELFTNSQSQRVFSALWVTVSCAAIAAVVSTLFGTISAVGIYGYRRGWRSTVLNITYLPMVNPDIITGVSMFMLLVMIKIPMGFTTLVLAHIAFNVPYVIFAVMPKLMQMDPRTYEAALDLGAKPNQALRRVIVPQLMPSIITGGLLAFTLSMDDFIISWFVGGDAQNLSTLVYSQAKLGVKPTMNALSALMFVVVLVLLVVTNRRSNTMLNI